MSTPNPNDNNLQINLDNPNITDPIVDPIPPKPVIEEEEKEDENDIYVGDKASPIVMLFGPRSSGKSMTLVRLSRYLRQQGYVIKVDTTFKASASYQARCDRFETYLDTKEALPGTALTDFLLIKIIKNGKTICQFLEAPGEDYFDPKNIKATNFKPYMTEIIRHLPNRKIWAFIAEADWHVNQSIKSAYVGRIRNCMGPLVKDTDRFLILYNKIDLQSELFKKGHINIKAAQNNMRNEYEGLEDIFKNNHVISSLWRSHDYKFVPFSTGIYLPDENGVRYLESDPMYPKMLWENLLEQIRG